MVPHDTAPMCAIPYSPVSGEVKLAWLKALNIWAVNCRRNFSGDVEPLLNSQILVNVTGSPQIGEVTGNIAEMLAAICAAVCRPDSEPGRLPFQQAAH